MIVQGEHDESGAWACQAFLSCERLAVMKQIQSESKAIRLLSSATASRPILVCGMWQMMWESYRFRKDVRDWPFRCRENHTSQKACSGSGLGFVHDPFEVLFDGVFA